VETERSADCGSRAFSRQRIDVDDKTVFDRQQDEREYPVIAHGDDTDPIADRQMQQRWRCRRAEIAEDPRGDGR
jgi:hypothetical protein